jgi:hypothetical protein
VVSLAFFYLYLDRVYPIQLLEKPGAAASTAVPAHSQ